jgi:L-rhamnose mutarotase
MREAVMERYAWQAKLKEGCLAEYRRRHDGLWQELKLLLKDAGICNYSIFTNGTDLFGYYECEKGAEFAARAQKNSSVAAKWNEYMKDIIDMTLDPVTGAQPSLTEVFRLE